MSFKQHLEQMSFDDLVPLWNEWCAQCGQDDTIYDSIEEFAELYSEDGVELARKVFFGSVDNWYDKVYLDGYGNFQSCYRVESSPIDIDALVDFMKEENHPDYVSWCDEQPSFAKRAGLGITTGGYCGGVKFDKVDQVWNEYKLDADPEMLKDWEE